MKEIQKETVARFVTETYCFDDLCDLNGRKPGIWLMWECITIFRSVITEIAMNVNGEKVSVSANNDLADSRALEARAGGDVEKWVIQCAFTNERNEPVEAFIFGTGESDTVQLRYRENARVPFGPYIRTLEERSWVMYNPDPDAVKKMVTTFGFNDRVSILSLLKLKKYEDIYDEFRTSLRDDGAFDWGAANYPVRVGGISAYDLYKDYHKAPYGWSILTCYDVLIWMREHPDDDFVPNAKTPRERLFENVEIA